MALHHSQSIEIQMRRQYEIGLCNYALVGLVFAFYPIPRTFPLSRPQADYFIVSRCSRSRHRWYESDRLPDFEFMAAACHCGYSPAAWRAAQTTPRRTMKIGSARCRIGIAVS